METLVSGTTNPNQAKLVVNGSQNTDVGNFGYFNNAGNSGTLSGANDYSIYASDRIAATEFNTFSDKRIKNIKGISNARNDLKVLSKIEITDYTL